ncbi:MAG TPA: GDYXXLXY domain-containing protein [Ohtaekwangia sp.]
MKNLILALFALMCLAQWFVPGKMISDQEDTRQNGTVYKFKTQPIDPTDPFRGSYITLRFEAASVQVDDYKEWSNGEEVFAVLKNDSTNFAVIESISKTVPEGHDYIKTRIDYVSEYAPYTVRLTLPFERFYLEESKAPKAEDYYRQAQQDNSRDAFALVSVKNGHAALQDVMIDDRSIVEIVREANANQPQ